MNTSDGSADPPKPLLSVIEGTGCDHYSTPQSFHQISWSLDVLCDLKLAAERQGFEDVAREIEVTYHRVKFLLTRNA